jgi:hypothetical protein
VLFRSDPPLELQGMKGVGKTGEKGEVGFITFGTLALNIQAYVTDKTSPISETSYNAKNGREYLTHSDLQRLLPLPHQSLEGACHHDVLFR